MRNLGYLFTDGLQRRIIEEVFAGVVAVVVIALIVDLLLVLAGRALMPWTRTATKTATKAAVSRTAAMGSAA